MANTSARTGLQLRSTVKTEDILELSLASVPTPEPKPEEVVVRIDASPINGLALILARPVPARSRAAALPG